MSQIVRLIFTVVFGLLWWWVFRHVGPDLLYLMILGSVLAVCVCCCSGRGEAEGEWNFDRYMACIRRCWLPTVVLMVGLFLIGVIAVWIGTHAFPSGAALTNILIAAIGAPLFVRLICCAYD